MRFRLVAAVLSILTLAGMSAPSYAGTFTSAEFLKWPTNNKNTFMDGAIMMAGGIAAINTEDQGSCIYQWYFDEDVHAARKELQTTMQEYPDVPPSGVIIAVLQKQCGSLNSGKYLE